MAVQQNRLHVATCCVRPLLGSNDQNLWMSLGEAA